jgi:hypothetical protein
MGEFRGMIARLASKNAKFKEELTSLRENSSMRSAQANYGFFDNVPMLEVVTDVTKPKVTAIISQMRNPIFNRPLDEVIHLRANFDFLQHQYAKTQDEINSWTDVEYINVLERISKMSI